MDGFHDTEYFTYDDLKGVFPFLETTNFGKIYHEFNEIDEYDELGKAYCNEIKDSLPISNIPEDIPYNFCNIIYKISVKINEIQNEVFNEIEKNDKIYCFCLKYWLYDQINTFTPKGSKMDKQFQSWKDQIEEKVSGKLRIPCTFNELTWDKYNKLKSIYAFILLYYKNINTFHEKNNVFCKYLNFFGKGLKAYYESIHECSNEKKDEIYCKEFNEFQKIYKLDKIYWENSKFNTEYIYVPESKDNCPLEVESLQSPLIISYKDKKNILYLSNKPIDFQKSTIIPTSSAIGAGVGISAFLLYLYKYTSLGSLFGTQMQRNNINFDNMAEETNDFTIPASKLEHTHFENTNYKISYSTLKNS
ncbi:PIR Superfamily Protein [Plasmodium ovale curtisi]|uniref:PIR Superfamily Protein n=1 Tax=Plasmodium ovale curtisi TaxID=864141 RepID=A0A1A8WV37_PLAOA|nr:PIR Superfamily Protein [Plasmodium ovale curtisi]